MIEWLVITHALVAALAVGHVLLHKEDVVAAVGWIGFSIVMPFFGPLLYALLGINRVERRAARAGAERPTPDLPRPADLFAQAGESEFAHLHQLADVGTRVVSQQLLPGNDVRPYQDGTDAYPPMLKAIDEAQASIALSSYIFRADRVGHRFADALARARARGVDVRVMIDSIGSGFVRAPVAARLRAAGVAVTVFSRDLRPWRLSVLNLRNHKKLLVVDGRIGFVGGLNFGEENEVGSRHAVRDIHFEVRGPVVRQMLASFASDWEFSTGERLTGAAWWPSLEPAGTVRARGVSSGPDGTIGSIAMLFAAAITEAEERVRIVTPYFLPDQSMTAFLKLAVLKGVAVEIVLPASSDQTIPHWAMRAQMRVLARSGMRIFLSAEPFDHSKLMSVDGRWCAFGSANWDQRSLRLNFEFILECHDAAVTDELDTLIDAKVAQAVPLERSGILDAPLPVRLRDAAARLASPYL